MKNIFCFLLVLMHFTSFSQSSAHAEVEYSFFSDADIPTLYFTTLYIDKNVSVFHEKTNENAVRGEARTEDGKRLQSGSRKTVFMEPYLKIDHNKQEVLFFDQIGANKFLIKDNYPDLPWTITSETKTIEGYTCTKATVDFRGREWIAWFTPEIPLPFGPWKLHGLPGLIMETHDATNRYTWKAVKIEFKKPDLLEKEFQTLIKTKNKKPISYQQFLNNTKEYHANVEAKLLQMNPDLVEADTHIPNNSLETNFEWDN